MATCDCKLSVGDEYRKLLLAMKSTVEGILANKLPNVWNTYGGLNRLGNDVDKILTHRTRSSEGARDCWTFFGGLRVLQPTFAPVLERHRVTTNAQNAGKSWVIRSLEEHTLSKQLRILLQDVSHVNSYYQENAFICQPEYTVAFLLCLDAVEQNELSLLTDIDPTLLVTPEFPKWPCHSRTSSLPVNGVSHTPNCSCETTRSNSFTPETWTREPISRSLSTSSKLRRSFSRDNDSSNSSLIFPRRDSSEGDLKLSNYHPQSTPTTEETKETSDNVEFTQISKTESDDKTDVNTTIAKSCDNSQNEPINNHSDNPKEELENFCHRKSTKNSDFRLSTKRLRSFTSSSRQQDCHHNLNWQWKYYWMNLRKTRSEPDLNSTSLLGNQKMKEEICPKSRMRDNFSCVNCAKESHHQQNLLNLSEVTSLTNSMSSSSHSLSILKIDYLNNSTTVTEENEPKINQDKNQTLGELQNKQTEDNGSTNTLCLTDICEDEGCTCTTLPLKKNLRSTKESTRRMTHQRSISDVTPPTFHEKCHPLYNQNQKNPRLPEKTRKKSLLEEGGSSVLPMTECSFPRPTRGQSLTSFLSSQEFHSCAELDKENNHFSISEALITAIEQMKWREMMRKRTAEEEEEESDEEIQLLKRRIQIRRNERQREKDAMKRNCLLLSDGRTDTTSMSNSSFGSPHSSAEYPESSSTDSVDELVLSADEADTTNQLVALRDNGLSLSMASLYSDADVQRGTIAIHPVFPTQPKNVSTPTKEKSDSFSASCSSSLSAELVALSLLRLFPEKQLPKASDLKWLVSEQDVPQNAQTLLPLPASWMFPNDGEISFEETNTRWRGTLEWAPPRAQIIFNIHPVPQRKAAMAKQNFRCAGCGMKIEINYIKRFRYCEYLGKYFCHCCHNNHQTYIPGRILRKWDFSKCYVSNFSYDLLDKMFQDPLFNVMDINPALYRRVRALEQIRDLRQQLFSLKDFIQTCRYSVNLQAAFEQQPWHLLKEIHVYSIHDLILAKNGELSNTLKSLVQEALFHINKCQLCQMKGFICELCNNNQVIFPFQLQTVWQCLKCWGCYHRTCYASSGAICPKCKRIQERKQRISQECVNSDNEL